MASDLQLPSTIFLQLVIALSHATYKADFRNFTGMVLKYNTTDYHYHKIVIYYVESTKIQPKQQICSCMC